MISSELLRRYPNFAGIGPGYLKEVAMISRSRNFTAGERLFYEGDAATHFMIIVTGEIHIVYELGDGSDVIADTLVAGDPLAWSALLDPHKLTASGVASKNGSLIEIEAEGLRRLCEEDKDFGYTMLKEVGKTLRSRLRAMRIVTAASLPEPVESIVL